MIDDEFTLYRRWLECCRDNDKINDKHYAQESFSETIQQSPAYQGDAMVNGNFQPIIATRKDTRKCDVAIPMGFSLHIGDLVQVFNEHWICVELYTDEYGLSYGELWMCNQIFTYQDHELNVIHKYAILDDGSYSSGSDKAIMVTNNSFNCYISLDAQSKTLFVDKRLAISAVYDSKGNEILEVGKIKWIDVNSKNFGAGSHLMVFGINDDAYSAENDNIEKMICDYEEKQFTKDEAVDLPDGEKPIGELVIDGRSTLRMGSSRTYAVKAISGGTGETTIPPEVIWGIECESDAISISPDGYLCKVSVREDDSLIGVSFLLKCECVTNEFTSAKYLVEVV